MKHKNFVIQISVLLLLIVASIGGYSLGKSAPQVDNSSQNYLPPLIELDLPPQTVNGITADLESYYADGLRLLFAVRIIGSAESYFPDSITIKDNSNQFINAGYGFQADAKDLSLYLVDVYLENPLETQRFEGVLEISVYPFSTEVQNLLPETVMFKFEASLPLKPVLTLNPNQTISVNKIDMFLEKIVISPAFTQMYLCYNKPSNADWMIGGSEFIVDSQTAPLGTYTLLFDSEYGDTGKSIEPNWSPPIEKGRCVKLGSPIGSENPKSIELNILNLEQSMPEAIPEDELAVAREKLLQQGIDMDWQVFDYGNGGGGSGPVYNKLPAGVTEEEAYKKFIEVLGYAYQGPWEFTINP
ncbi:MAG: hypothetical protein KF758_05685 [Anaerolineales bacterium]|nr:hypothetical protein [Anaerolineales bacterium]MBX3036386.1 hypothetical protein [Anaerolineales bacterium]